MSTSRSVLRALAVAGAMLASQANARPFYVPGSDEIVLTRLPPGVRRLATPESSAASGVQGAIASAGRLASIARAEADPRLLGRAEALLAPWSGDPSAPVDLILLRAQIAQGLHRFDSAMADLNLVLEREPRHPGAWLMKATLHQVLGESDAARHACLQLARFADGLTATTAAAALAGLASTDDAPVRRLRAMLEVDRSTNAPILAWAWTTLGELQSLHARPAEAEASFRKALRFEPGSPYILAALADLLLSLDRCAEVPPLLGETAIDGLRLRLAEAETRLNPGSPRARRFGNELSESFDLATRRRDELHLREHARFVLRVRGDARTALPLARRNWAIQREPADLDLLLEASSAAGDEAAHTDALDWARTHMPAVARRHEMVASTATRGPQ